MNRIVRYGIIGIAVALSAARHDAARTFCEQLASSVTELAMEGARFEFSFDELGFEP